MLPVRSTAIPFGSPSCPWPLPLVPMLRQKVPVRREFFDATVAGIGDQNVSVGINSNSSGRIKLPLAGSLSAFKHVSYTFAGTRELGGDYRSSRKCAHALLKLRECSC